MQQKKYTKSGKNAKELRIGNLTGIDDLGRKMLEFTKYEWFEMLLQIRKH